MSAKKVASFAPLRADVADILAQRPVRQWISMCV
jgi:hypothetical protein